MGNTLTHTPVLLREAVDALLEQPATRGARHGIYVDATFGRGGHSRLILRRLCAKSRLIAFDKDPDALAEATSIQDNRFSILHQGFAHLGDLPAASVAGILLDLGISSPQVDSAARGFSFRFDGPLDMRMDTTRGQTVAQWLALADVEEMAQVIRDYGEERFASPIARSIAAHRQTVGTISTTTELARIVSDTVKTREPGQHPATRTFQAFRIFINAELEELQLALAASLKVLQPGGRLVVISFHSLEDRMVKQFIARHSREVVDRRVPQSAPQVMQLRAVARIKPNAAEVAANPRSRSAVMRVAERINTDGAES